MTSDGRHWRACTLVQIADSRTSEGGQDESQRHLNDERAIDRESRPSEARNITNLDSHIHWYAYSHISSHPHGALKHNPNAPSRDMVKPTSNA
jgi:hypothetical protein